VFGESRQLGEGRVVPYVRFFAIDAVLTSATSDDGKVLAKAIALFSDSERAVRWKAGHFLSKATRAQLDASLPYAATSRLGALTAWLVDLEDNLNTMK
jgi:hypothetical protein